MRSTLEPISLGSPRSTTIDTGTFRVTDVWFPPGTAIEPHFHDRSIVSVMLAGSFTTHIASRELECVENTLWTEPCEERHANYVGSGGAHVVVTQPDPDRADLQAKFSRLMTEVTSTRDPVVVADAKRMAAEMAAPDALTPLVLESIIVLVLARATRLTDRRVSSRGVPNWLNRARDIIHDSFPAAVSLDRLAQDAGVTQWHLAHEFRRYFHATVGEYARALRINRALQKLAEERTPISEIAFETGFADQSHLTRACTAATGLSPAAYRNRLNTRRRG